MNPSVIGGLTGTFGTIGATLGLGARKHLLLPETVRWLQQLSNPLPSKMFVFAIDDAIREFIFTGNWYINDAIWIFFTEQKQHSLVSLINPLGINAKWPTNISVVGAPTWKPLLGWTGIGTASNYLQTNYTPSNGINYQPNNASMSVWKTTNVFGSLTDTVDMGAISSPGGGFNPSVGIQDNVLANINVFYINESSNSAHGGGGISYSGASKGPGLYTIYKNSASNRTVYYNGKLLVSNNGIVTTQVATNPIQIMNDGANGSPSARTYAFAKVGGVCNEAAFYQTMFKLKTRVNAFF